MAVRIEALGRVWNLMFFSRARRRRSVGVVALGGGGSIYMCIETRVG